MENIVRSIGQSVLSGINCGLVSYFVGTNAKVSTIYCFGTQLFKEISDSAQRFENALWNQGSMIFQTGGCLAAMTYVPSRIRETYDPNFTFGNINRLLVESQTLEAVERGIFSYFFPTESDCRLPEMFFQNVTAFNTSNVCLPSEAP